MLSSPVFQIIPALEGCSYKISAMDCYENKLYVGDESGNLHKYIVRVDQTPVIPNPSDSITSRIAKSKINVIKYLPGAGQLLVQAGGLLQVVDSERLERGQEILTKECELFAVDEDPRSSQQCVARLVVYRSDGKLVIYEQGFADKGKFGMVFEVKPPLKISSLAWYGKNIFLSYAGKSYAVMDIDSKKFKDVEDLKDFNFSKHMIKVVSDEETLLLGVSDTFFPVHTHTTKKLTKSPISVVSKIIGVTVYHPYIVVLGDAKVYVYNKIEVRNRQRILQEIPFEASSGNTARCMTITYDKIFFALTSKIFYLKLVPYEIQIQRNLQDGRVEDAFMIFDQYVPEDDFDRHQRYDQLKLDAAWVFFKDLRFREAEDLLRDLNYDIKEFLGLFLMYLPSKPLFDAKSGKTPSMGIIYEEAKKRPWADSDLKKDERKALKYAKEFLSRILENRRKFLLDNYKDQLREKPTFMTSETQSPFKEEIKAGKVNSLSVGELLEIVDFALIRVYLDLQKEEQLANFLKEKLYCSSLVKELDQYFCSDPKPSDTIQARYFEQFGRYKEALEVWANALKHSERAKSDRACDEIVNILTTYTGQLKAIGKHTLILEYLEKVLLKNSSYAKQFFMNNDYKLLSPDIIEKYLNDNFGKIPHLRETFLEVIVNDKKIELDTFHTNLALHYVKKIKTLRAEESQTTPELNSYMKKFSNFIRDPNAKYNPSTILKEIRDCNLLDDEIYLYGKNGDHDEALNKLLKFGDYAKAEKYCANEKNAKLFSKLFALYIKKLYKYNEFIKSEPNNPLYVQEKNQLKQTINLFLMKYASHPQMEPEKVLELIPDEWPIEYTLDNGVYHFLYFALSNSLHQRRMNKIAKNESEIESLSMECKLMKAKSAHVVITNTRTCAVCKKVLGNTVFAVYPNGKVAHHTCTQDKLTVCPVTKQDFVKTFSG